MENKIKSNQRAFKKCNRTLKIMKFSFLMLFFCFFTITAGNVFSQQKELSLNLRNVTLKKAISEIEKASDYVFLITDEVQLELNKKASIHANKESIHTILEALLKDTSLEFTVVERQVSVYKNNSSKKTEPAVEKIKQQKKTISGTITDVQGKPVIGANILEKGTTNGTVTDIDGNFTLQVDENAILHISYIGYLAQDVPTAEESNFKIILLEDVMALEEVVVTGFGIEKRKKALGYSVTEVSGDDLTEAREINIADALAGKVAGVNVSNVATGASGSSQILIRGNTSLSASNQPLYVIDGIPIDNSQLGVPGTWGGSDWGDGTSSLMNSSDIDNISILKGNAAAALYGSRASNGVILITSKKGDKRDGVGIEFSTNLVLEDMIDFTDYQKEYGHGFNGAKPTSQSEALSYGLYSYGAKLDGSSVIQYDGVSRPYSYVGSNLKKFYRTGSTWTNTLTLTGGNENNAFRFTVSNLDNRGIVPENDVNRKNFSLSVNGLYWKKLSALAKVDYIIEDVSHRSEISDSPGNVNYTLFSLPPSIDVTNFRGTTDKLGANEEGTELQFNSNVYVNNPYWVAYQYKRSSERNRIIGSLALKYDFTDWLYLQGRLGRDWSHFFRTYLTPYGTGYIPRGQMWEERFVITELNTDVMLGWDHGFNDFNLSGFVGGNYMCHDYDYIFTGGNDFNIPFFHDISNVANQGIGSNVQKYGVNSLLGSAEISYKDNLFLNVTGRQDWFSTLDAKSVLYPSASLSWIFSDAFNMPQWMTFGKLRLSWAQVGGGVDSPYQTSLSYSLLGGGYQGQPAGHISQSTVPNTELKPYKSTEYEIGTDIRLFNNRLGIDFTYYDKKTENDILASTISRASGYSSARVNVGEISNKGVELLINSTIIDRRNFRWNTSFNFAYNKNEVIRLAEDIQTLTMAESRTQSAYLANIVGHSYSQIYGYKFKTNDQGVRVYDSTGRPIRTTELYPLGSGISPTTMGLNNSLTYKDFYLDFLIDMKLGGHIYAASDAYGYTRGFHKNTLVGRESGLDVSGVDEEGNPFSYHIAPENLRTYYARIYQITEEFVQDASFIKMRQLVLGYNLQPKILAKTPFTSVNVSLVGRNLLLLWRKTTNIDPESNFIAGNAQGLEGFGVPATRSFGVNLSVKF